MAWFLHIPLFQLIQGPAKIVIGQYKILITFDMSESCIFEQLLQWILHFSPVENDV